MNSTHERPGKLSTGIAGLIMAISGASLWGISGTVASLLFIDYGFPFTTLVSMRMLIAGFILLVLWRPMFPSVKRSLFLFYSIVGMFGVQLTYLAAIYYSNAPTATLLQYLFLPIIMIYETFLGKIKFSRIIFLSLFLSLYGTFELITGFPFHSSPIILNPYAIFFGLMSAIEAFLYIILSGPLIKKNGTVPVITWAFLIGGLFSLIFSVSPSYSYFTSVTFSRLLLIISLVLIVAIGGTLIAFGLYLRSLRYIKATQTSLAGTVEPISAAVTSAIILGIFLTELQYIGGLLILCSIIIMQLFSKKVFLSDEAEITVN